MEEDSAGPTTIELEHLRDLADARLGVAEEIGWPAAIFGAIAVHLQWHLWFATVAAAVAVYVLAVRRYDNARSRAWDAWERATGSGKYFRSPEG